eukprot:9495688-Pyramimonas_sp.AAC.1
MERGRRRVEEGRGRRQGGGGGGGGKEEEGGRRKRRRFRCHFGSSPDCLAQGLEVLSGVGDQRPPAAYPGISSQDTSIRYCCPARAPLLQRS